MPKTAPKKIGIADPKEPRCCRYCLQEKPLEDFSTYRGSLYAWKCRKCQNAATKQWREKNLDKSRLHFIKYRYGLDSAQLFKIIGDGKCNICGDIGEQIDHDHSTGTVRGYLCKQCNRGLGHFRDKIEIMEAAIAYLGET